MRRLKANRTCGSIAAKNALKCIREPVGRMQKAVENTNLKREPWCITRNTKSVILGRKADDDVDEEKIGMKLEELVNFCIEVSGSLVCPLPPKILSAGSPNLVLKYTFSQEHIRVVAIIMRSAILSGRWCSISTRTGKLCTRSGASRNNIIKVPCPYNSVIGDTSTTTRLLGYFNHGHRITGFEFRGR